VLGEHAPPELRKIDEALLLELQQMIATSSPGAKDERRLERRIKELEASLVEKDAELAKRDEQIVLLSKLSVTMNGAIENAVQLPETMQMTRASIDTATVHQVHAPLPPSLVVEAAAPKHLAPQAGGTPVNEGKMRSLQQRLRQLSSHQSRIFLLLVERDTPMTVEEIAAWLGIARSTAQRYLPPDALVRIGLVKRSQSGNAHVYRSTLRDHGGFCISPRNGALGFT
jgi:Fic family protein